MGHAIKVHAPQVGEINQHRETGSNLRKTTFDFFGPGFQLRRRDMPGKTHADKVPRGIDLKGDRRFPGGRERV
jgi:hypothetical protein